MLLMKREQKRVAVHPHKKRRELWKKLVAGGAKPDGETTRLMTLGLSDRDKRLFGLKGFE